MRAPDGTGIKGGRTAYHATRALTAIALIREFPDVFTEMLAVYHARLAARAALNGMYNGRRPDGRGK